MRTGALLLLFSCGLDAATLEDIRLLIPKGETRPAPKPLKDALRAWAEPQFIAVREPLAAAAAMNGELKRAGLIPQLSEIRLLHPSGEKDYLTLVTAVGVTCGTDYSMHLYTWAGDTWKHLLTNENHDESHRTAPVYNPISYIRLSHADRSGERIFAVGGSQEDCMSCWHTFFYRAWLLHSGTPTLMLDRRAYGYVCDRMIDIKAEPNGLVVTLAGSHPNPDLLTALVTETYSRQGSKLYLYRRAPVVLLEDLDEETYDPVRFLLSWVEERVAPEGSLDWRIKDLNAKLSRVQLPKEVSPAKIELLPSARENQATLILHAAGKQTRRTLTHRNGQWEMSGE